MMFIKRKCLLTLEGGYQIQAILTIPKPTKPIFPKEMERQFIKNFNESQLEKKTARFIPYTHVRFFHGYAKKRPWIEKEIESITIGKPKKGMCPDKWLDTEFFIIKFK